MSPLPDTPAALHAYVTAGVGLPELLHAEGGVFVLPRLSLGAHVGWVILNPEVGLEVTGYLLGTPVAGRPPRHALTLQAQGMVNPAQRPLSLNSGGDRLAAYAGAYVGYAWTADVGFALRVHAGAVLYAEGGFAAGPNGTVALGWVF